MRCQYTLDFSRTQCTALATEYGRVCPDCMSNVMGALERIVSEWSYDQEIGTQMRIPANEIPNAFLRKVTIIIPAVRKSPRTLQLMWIRIAQEVNKQQGEEE